MRVTRYRLTGDASGNWCASADKRWNCVAGIFAPHQPSGKEDIKFEGFSVCLAQAVCLTVFVYGVDQFLKNHFCAVSADLAGTSRLMSATTVAKAEFSHIGF